MMVEQLEWATATCSDLELALACAVESSLGLDSKTNYACSWEPAPRTLREILNMPDGPVRREWLKSVLKELKTLMDAGTFSIETMLEGEVSTPMMETFKVKINSDGSSDKLKTRIVLRGNLQSKSISEDKWSPTASFRSLKMFLVHAF
jgi:hypothetical protein